MQRGGGCYSCYFTDEQLRLRKVKKLIPGHTASKGRPGASQAWPLESCGVTAVTLPWQSPLSVLLLDVAGVSSQSEGLLSQCPQHTARGRAGSLGEGDTGRMWGPLSSAGSPSPPWCSVLDAEKAGDPCVQPYFIAEEVESWKLKLTQGH